MPSGEEPDQRVAEEAAACLRTLNAFSRLAVSLRKQSSYTDFTSLPTQLDAAELKRLLVTALKSELRWAARRSVRELELLYRTELDKEGADWDKVRTRALLLKASSDSHHWCCRSSLVFVLGRPLWMSLCTLWCA